MMKGLIKEVLPPGAIDKETISILANALYFNGAWLNAFNAKLIDMYIFIPMIEN